MTDCKLVRDVRWVRIRMVELVEAIQRDRERLYAEHAATKEKRDDAS